MKLVKNNPTLAPEIFEPLGFEHIQALTDLSTHVSIRVMILKIYCRPVHVKRHMLKVRWKRLGVKHHSNKKSINSSRVMSLFAQDFFLT